MRRTPRLSGWLATFAVLAVTTLATGAAAPANASGVVDQGTFHETDSFVDTNFCDTGRSVQGDVTVDGRFLVRTVGRDQVEYGMDTSRVTVVWTDLATGRYVTDSSRSVLSKDLKVTDNGDGTITAVFLQTGVQATYSEDGRLLARNDGQVRFHVVYDYVNDEELEFELIFGSTGTNDDFCEAVLAYWGV